MSGSAAREVWVLGASGRCGRGVAARLAKRGVSLVLVGREEARLRSAAAPFGEQARVVVAADLAAMAAAIMQATPAPAVVVNTIGPFTETALPILRACPSGTHYADLANDVVSVRETLGAHEEAAAAQRCVVTGAGYGFVSTESVVRKLCEGRPPAERVRVTAVPLISGAGSVGEALAATIVEGLVSGGYRYEAGRLVRARLGSDPERLTLPDGGEVTAGAVPLGDLEAAHRASGAPFVVAASSEIPSSPVTRVIFPLASALLSWRVLGDAATRRLARVNVTPPAKARAASWAHARVTWSGGEVREGWLRAPEGMQFTSGVLAEVAVRLARGEGRPGAYTPCALFGAELAEAAGAEFVAA